MTRFEFAGAGVRRMCPAVRDPTWRAHALATQFRSWLREYSQLCRNKFLSRDAARVDLYIEKYSESLGVRLVSSYRDTVAAAAGVGGGNDPDSNGAGMPPVHQVKKSYKHKRSVHGQVVNVREAVAKQNRARR